MGYVINKKIMPGESEYINTFRSGNGNAGPSPKNTCLKTITASDPFDFSVEYRRKAVKTRVPFVSKSGKRYYRTKYVYVDYPYYNFVTKTRSVIAWRFELQAGKRALKKISQATPHINERLEWLEKRLRKEGVCRPVKPRSADVQHSVTHWKSTISGLPAVQQLKNVLNDVAPVPLITNDNYGFRSIEFPFEEVVGQENNGVNAIYSQTMIDAIHNAPITDLLKGTTVSTITAMLWPSSDDFQESDASPLIDLSEAAADGVFPLGPPPSASEAHDKLVKNCMSDTKIKAVSDLVDFASNAHLWKQLVLEPVIQSAAALSTSVEANDMAIETYAKMAKSGKWQQGKNLRLYGESPLEAALSFGAYDTYTTSVGSTANNSNNYGVLTHNMTYNKFEANAMFVYKLSLADSASLNTSGMRLGQFFNRLSSSLDTVIHNIIPLSFVYDWFSSEYTGILNLKDKVYMPVDQYKVITSFNCALDIESQVAHTVYASKVKFMYGRTINAYDEDSTYMTYNVDRQYNQLSHGTWPVGKLTWVSSKKYHVVVSNTPLEVPHEYSIKETHNYYSRYVYENPSRRTDFSNGDLGILNFDYEKRDPLADDGKKVTLAALLWGMRDSAF